MVNTKGNNLCAFLSVSTIERTKSYAPPINISKKFCIDPGTNFKDLVVPKTSKIKNDNE